MQKAKGLDRFGKIRQLQPMYNCLNFENRVLQAVLQRRKSKSCVPVRVVKVWNVSA